MRTIGFPISHKENERRRTIIPQDVLRLSFPSSLYIERGYGKVLGISDDDYARVGCHVCSRDVVLSQNIICDPKIGDAEYLEQLNAGQVLFGWIHATQNREITDKLVNSKLTCYAWEKMYDSGRHIFWRNNELAGEAAVLHAFQCYGQMPYESKVAVLGRGNTARGAMKILNMFGADVSQYNRRTEHLFKKEISDYDAIVNCILWDATRTDHIIYKEDLHRMKPGALIIDVSCDRNGGIETSIPTTIENPTYYVDGICHYVVDHTPSLFYRTFSVNNSTVITPFLDELVTGRVSSVLTDSLIIQNGVILDHEIIEVQRRS